MFIFQLKKQKNKELSQRQKNKTKSRCTPTTTTVPLMPEKKRGKLFNIKSLPLYNPGHWLIDF
jgi:hypothetical protein